MSKRKELLVPKEPPAALPIVYEPSPPCQYANNMVVQVDESLIYLNFYQMAPPFCMEGDPESTHATAQPVAGVAVTIENLPLFIRTMQRQYDLVMAELESLPNKPEAEQ